MRLIDKDALLEAIGEENDDDSDVEFMQGVYSQWKCDTDIIKSSPEVYEGPEIVRCKDCINGAYAVETGMLPFIICCGVDHDLDWFCADGKRR